MPCNCKGNTIKTHHVTRNFCVKGEYELCGRCGAIEWLWMTDDLEIEIRETPNHFFKTGAAYGYAREA